MDDTDAEAFGALLRRYRMAAGLTQEALAARAGLNERVIRGLERGWRHRPRRDTVRLLVEGLRLPDPERAAFEQAARRASVVTDGALDDEGGVPGELTPLVGRAILVATAVGLLQRPDVRLLTLTGPGGVGKTRLGERVAAAARADYADGALMVDLAPIDDPARVLPAIARALGLRVRDGGDRALADSLATALRERRLLLVLDNVEHVKAAAPRLVDLLAACPRLTILATSQAALRVRGEQELAVPPLPTPDPATGLRADALARFPAVALFAQRARAVDPDFRLTDANAAAVAAICRQVDGLPLAIELAAARVKLLPPGALLARLTPRLPLLTGGGPDRPERQRTMRAAIAWSDDLLDAAGQAAFHRLAVFAGGCALDAAEEVCAPSDGPAGSGPGGVGVLDALAALVDASLAWQRATPDGEPRIGMLETIREYAAERLAASGEAAEARRRHAAHYLALAEAAEPRLLGPDAVAQLDRLERERDNLRAALRWAREGGQGEVGLRLAGSLYRFWWIRGHLSEGRAWLEEMLRAAPRDGHSPSGSASASARAKALHGAGVLAYSQRDNGRAAELLRESLALYRAGGDGAGMAAVLGSLGGVARKTGDDERALALTRESLALGRELGDRASVAFALANLGHIARRRGEGARAAALYEEGLAAWRALGDARGIAYTLANLALAARERGAWERALALYGKSLALYEGLGDTGGRAFVLTSLGDVARARGDDERAIALYEESLALHRAVGDAQGVARARERRAAVGRQG